MPDLSAKQFSLFSASQYDQPGAAQAQPSTLAEPPSTVAQQGQGVLPLREGDKESFLSRGGILPVEEDSDRSWEDSGFSIGGLARTSASFSDDARNVTKTWESLPVQEIPRDTVLRSGQVAEFETSNAEYLRNDRFLGEVDVDHEDVDTLKQADTFRDRTDGVQYGTNPNAPRGGPERLPWVLRMNSNTHGEPRDYVVEGTHRTTAMRERGAGVTRAHVFESRPDESMRSVVGRFGSKQE